ncbi:MAG TPA: NAD+ synthase [Acidobacteriaceae bacterium]|nr:NAD+ synthase [Acidobacteriaceae bacterium]
MKIALAQINPTVGDFTGNTAKILDFTGRAKAAGAELAIFPELAVCGYPPADFLEKDTFIARASEALAQIAAATTADGKIAVLCGGVMPAAATVGGKHVRNVAALLEKGRISFVQQKRLLPFYDVFDEQRYFEPAEMQTLCHLNGQQLAITICEDAWNDKTFWPRRFYRDDPVEEQMAHWDASAKQYGNQSGEPRVILNISSSPYWRDKRSLRAEMLCAIAKRHNAFVAMVNQVGGNDSLIFDGTSLAIAPSGKIVAQGKSFAEDLILFDTSALVAAEPRIQKDSDELAATWDALVLGTRDYVRKCGFSQVAVGLSGGIDSALVAAIAAEALGGENVLGVGMPSQFSSQGSIEDARALAENLGIRFELLPIGEAFAAYTQTLDPLFAGTDFGLAEENLQSRIRGGLLMAIANKFNALVLTTGNKSEMSTGYCTLYGDMVGALAVIGDVMKTRVYDLSRYANRNGIVIPTATIEKPPSAELRPGQMDTDSLPPYSVLDPILEAYVERYESAAQIAVAQGLEPGLVESVIKLVERSEYKRQQAAPVLKVTRKSFGLGRRFPIAVKVQV